MRMGYSFAPSWHSAHSHTAIHPADLCLWMDDTTIRFALLRMSIVATVIRCRRHCCVGSGCRCRFVVFPAKRDETTRMWLVKMHTKQIHTTHQITHIKGTGNWMSSLVFQWRHQRLFGLLREWHWLSVCDKSTRIVITISFLVSSGWLFWRHF